MANEIGTEIAGYAGRTRLTEITTEITINDLRKPLSVDSAAVPNTIPNRIDSTPEMRMTLYDRVVERDKEETPRITAQPAAKIHQAISFRVCIVLTTTISRFSLVL
ncbi:hypothetical protein [Halostagnicola kamekurae]|uniref:hypothetical protein n=1 Tax=Halostagnicola kamekurae TaxID=619731 RepID=UPI0011138461|nr:hypothetical protein [Halostagnicola kamekurae]